MPITEPKPIQIEEAEVEQLIEKAERGALEAAEQRRLVPLLTTLLWLERTLRSTRISLAKLKRILFGKKTEKQPRPPKAPNGGGNGSDEGGSTNDPSSGSPPSSSGTPPGGSNTAKARGHGRRAAADYGGAQTVSCAHPKHQAGDRCPSCQRGRLYRSRPLVRVRFRAQPLAQVTR